jgi:hypothetical protein
MLRFTTSLHRLRAYNSLNHFLKSTVRRTPHASSAETYPPAGLRVFCIHRLQESAGLWQELRGCRKRIRLFSVSFLEWFPAGLRRSLFVVGRRRGHQR